ncbi:MAG TPA: RNA-binding S4 domain-containing protein [Pseudogracilibacillus sp.]|nr:RNA-binding S4 domain-containing protein [Pseudogracilibacillus sp.]
MRIDKYLKTARIIKRRPLAKEIAEQGRIKVNGTVVKPSVDVQPGDEMEIRFARTVLTIKILQVKDHVKKDDVSGLYEIIREEKTDQEQ